MKYSPFLLLFFSLSMVIGCTPTQSQVAAFDCELGAGCAKRYGVSMKGPANFYYPHHAYSEPYPYTSFTAYRANDYDEKP